ncbi:MAG: serine/threonine-protein kinase, partial [Deltaproteobacteria bacterium]|nr:serine/threonine-protein kinase [Deltaproteobacteria bacterium]
MRKIASGGMGSVELAVAASGRSLGRMVAVKRLHPHLAEDERFLSMFFDELAITASLHHPHIVEIVDWGKDDRGHFLVLEYVPGDSLFALARATQKRGIPFPVELALYIVACTAEGLHAAHELRDDRGESRHLVHRDVSHSNVLVGIHGQVTLIDFGVAKARDNLTHTVTGTLKGKFGYLSPEQARGEALDRRSDLFSLGVVLWELLSGQRLFHGATEWESMRRTLEQDAPALHPDWPEVPAAVDELLARALARSRDERPATCLDLADALRAIARAEGYTAGEDELARFFREALPERVEELERLMVVAQASVEEATAIHRGLPVGADTVVTPPPAAAAPSPAVAAPSPAVAAPARSAWLRLGLPAALV